MSADERPDVAATRLAYDTVARSYADLLRDHLAGSPHDRAVLALFAELVLARGGGPVADLGCGPGRITGPLHDLGLDVSGIDLSPAMVEVARHDHPQLRFEVGDLTSLPLDDGSLVGVVCWYSIIHTPPQRHPVIFAELRRVVAADGVVLLAFHVGDHVHHIAHGYGHDIELDAYRLDPDAVTTMLATAGLAVTATLVRAAIAPERTRQAYLLATPQR